MLRSLSGTGLGGKLSAPDDGPGSSADDDVLALGRDLAARASAILRREGASPSALIAVGETMSAAGARWHGPGRGEAALGRRASDYPLWCEADGTFELILPLPPPVRVTLSATRQHEQPQ